MTRASCAWGAGNADRANRLAFEEDLAGLKDGAEVDLKQADGVKHDRDGEDGRAPQLPRRVRLWNTRVRCEESE